MCGIAGLWLAGGGDRATLEMHATRMAGTLIHRGPDDSGVWVDGGAGIALGHRRLSIVDLSPEGHQPMLSADGRYVIAFNGEIYNYTQMRRELEAAGAAPAWRGHSDTEVLLAAILHWGVIGAFERAVGMFAIALWDRKERVLRLIRDRMGEKPLYYGRVGEAVAFASELKALRTLPGWRGEIDRDALARFMQTGYVPAPESIYDGILKLPPGSLLTLGEAALRTLALPSPGRYWSFPPAAAAQRDALPRSPGEAADALERILRDAVAGQMVADVPLGAFLSGGIDSSAVVALMQAQSPRPVRTFTVGFAESEYNEAGHARAVARHLGTDHTELTVSPEEARAVIPRLPELYDEPFADSSQIPTFLVSSLARRHVTVSLSGDGGDELFGGYERYVTGESMRRRFGWMPAAMRRACAASLVAVPLGAWNGVFAALAPVLPRQLRIAMAGDKVCKYAALLEAAGEAELYQRFISPWPHPDFVLGASEAALRAPAESDMATFAERMMRYDALGYLPDGILVKVDRAAMAVSLETRVPFLDHRVVEFAARLPLAFKIHGGRGKQIVREVLHRYVPRELVERPKTGFSIPLDHWLRGPLREWARSLLDPERMRRQGYLDPSPVTRAWNEHASGVRNWQHRLWNVLMFQSWLERRHGGSAPES
ncbi:MAG: asparagine synthase (glutamine-hydrolyzing) [Betaproteobacteria bacterium]|nr:asparagine synthase (glutamine-hydrolyzing) [Betaproteobacteria bacterium]